MTLTYDQRRARARFNRVSKPHSVALAVRECILVCEHDGWPDGFAQRLLFKLEEAYCVNGKDDGWTADYIGQLTSRLRHIIDPTEPR